MGVGALALVGAFVLLGAGTQRLTGMGFALVASPLLVLVLGVHVGVQLTLLLGLVATALVLLQVWRQVEWSKAVGLLLSGGLGILPGTWVARSLPAPVLAVVIGTLVLCAVLATVASERARVFTGVGGLLTAGFLSGFMTVTAAVGGPAIVLYALSTRWEHARFVATAQVSFAGVSLLSLAASGLPALEPAAWAVAFGALGVGLVLGDLLARRVSADAARVLVIAVAVAGALATVVKGALELL